MRGLGGYLNHYKNVQYAIGAIAELQLVYQDKTYKSSPTHYSLIFYLHTYFIVFNYWGSSATGKLKKKNTGSLGSLD